MNFLFNSRFSWFDLTIIVIVSNLFDYMQTVMPLWLAVVLILVFIVNAALISASLQQYLKE